MEDRLKFNKRILSFIPYKYVVVSTSLSLDDVVKLFASSTSPVFDPISNPLPNPQKLQGDLSKEGFRVRLTNYYRISLTSVKGYFHPTKRGILLINMYVDPGPNFLFLLLLPFMGAIANELLKTTIFEDLAVVIGCLIGIILFSFANFIITDTLDWHIGNIIGPYILENKD